MRAILPTAGYDCAELPLSQPITEHLRGPLRDGVTKSNVFKIKKNLVEQAGRLWNHNPAVKVVLKHYVRLLKQRRVAGASGTVHFDPKYEP